ncbi:MAG: magnesium and cobalt transport protein CorA, partial [Solirubrobacteraceae bacterium]
MAIELPAASEAPSAAPVGGAPLPAVRLGGRRKAAVLMAALGSERAAEIMRHLREEEVESLSFELTKLGAIEERTTEAILF